MLLSQEAGRAAACERLGSGAGLLLEMRAVSTEAAGVESSSGFLLDSTDAVSDLVEGSV